MGNKTPGYEIERKFLIRVPDEAWLISEAKDVLGIRQTYLASQNGESARVRQITRENKVSYIHTVKKRISDLKREETEREISQEEYEKLLLFADKERKVIVKTRYCIPHGNHIFEIDIFPFWKEKRSLKSNFLTKMNGSYCHPKLLLSVKLRKIRDIQMPRWRAKFRKNKYFIIKYIK